MLGKLYMSFNKFVQLYYAFSYKYDLNKNFYDRSRYYDFIISKMNIHLFSSLMYSNLRNYVRMKRYYYYKLKNVFFKYNGNMIRRNEFLNERIDNWLYLMRYKLYDVRLVTPFTFRLS